MQNRNVHELRNNLVRKLRQFDTKEEEYEKEVRDVLYQLEQKHKQEVSELYDEIEDTKHNLEVYENEAMYQLKKMQNKIWLDRSLTREEKLEKINELQEAFDSEYNPEDEYNQYIEEKIIRKLNTIMFPFNFLSNSNTRPMIMNGNPFMNLNTSTSFRNLNIPTRRISNIPSSYQQQHQRNFPSNFKVEEVFDE